MSDLLQLSTNENGRCKDERGKPDDDYDSARPAASAHQLGADRVHDGVVPASDQSDQVIKLCDVIRHERENVTNIVCFKTYIACILELI